MTSAECGNTLGCEPGPQATTRLRIRGSPCKKLLIHEEIGEERLGRFTQKNRR